jgi:hypothetical protein
MPAVFRLPEDGAEMDRLQFSENFTRDLRNLRWTKTDGRGCHRHECLRSRGLQREKRIGAYPRGYPGETPSIGLEQIPANFQAKPVWIACHTADYGEAWYEETDEEKARDAPKRIVALRAGSSYLQFWASPDGQNAVR